MRNFDLWWVLAGIAVLIFFVPENVFAQITNGHYILGGGNFESKMTGLTNKLVSTLLPIASILGLVYACFLAVMGDGAAKQRITMVIVCCIIGLLAPVIIPWIKSIVGY